MLGYCAQVFIGDGVDDVGFDISDEMDDDGVTHRRTGIALSFSPETV
ncbi:hypothetical protein [Symbiopectobacterium purcellii]|uniref:Uncharacterized protein n=1 Tax=Symbiopectobacterium purcellii TaxID=2871826 RepID=A0ABX9AT23_9ENTR|nr:hypothetical protein [Symbiopectobacterium purcellii]QZN97161.1 hypothetical protein K6K13_07280 [Symbiopectobacterium purcellii]